MGEVRVSSWAELQERLYEESWRCHISRFRSRYAFRGIDVDSFDLVTSLTRLGSRYFGQEGHLLRNFRKYAMREAVGADSVWNWLALGQHHGLPTRVLDWTFSPYVALHFATDDLGEYERDAVIWAVDYRLAHQELPPRLRTMLDREEADVFTTEMLARGASTLPEFDDLAAEPFVVFFEPPSMDDRIVNQFALFSVMSDAQARLGDWLRNRPGLFRRLIIPAEMKWEIRDKLDQANITERVLFPGLDGLSRWLTRYYTPRCC